MRPPLKICHERIMMRSSMRAPASVLTTVAGQPPAIPLIATRCIPGQARELTAVDEDSIPLSLDLPRGRSRVADVASEGFR